MATTTTVHKNKTLPKLPEHLQLITEDRGIDGAITTLQTMSAMLDVMCSIDPDSSPIEPPELAKVFFMLKQWTDFARSEIEAECNENETPA